MINYRKIERIATELENRLGIGYEEDGTCGIDNGEMAVNPPTPSVAASCMTASEKEEGLRRLIRMAKSVKANRNLTSRQKIAALDKIRKVATENFSVTKSVLKNQPVDPRTVQKDMKNAPLNSLLNEIGRSTTVNEVVNECNEIGMNVKIAPNLLSRPIGSLSCQEVIKFAPVLTKILNEYKDVQDDILDDEDGQAPFKNTFNEPF